MGILSKFKEGVENQNRNRKERSAKGLGFKSNDDRIKQSQNAKTQAIKRNNNKKRKAELSRIGKEATMTKAEKIQRGVASFRKEMDSIQKESGGMFGNGNMTTKTLGVKKTKRKSRKRKVKKSNPMETDYPYGSGFQTSRFF